MLPGSLGAGSGLKAAEEAATEIKVAADAAAGKQADEYAKVPARAAARAPATSLAEAVGKDSVGVTNQVLKGKQPLTALSNAQRQAAADFYRATAERTTGQLKEAGYGVQSSSGRLP